MNHVASTSRGSAELRLFRHSALDAVFPLLTLAQAALVLALLRAPPPLALVAIALHVVWTSNTVAHIHLHTPLFRSRRHNRAFSIWLSVLTFIPQTIWKQRHLWHHAGEPRLPATLRASTRSLTVAALGSRLGRQGFLELAAITVVAATLVVVAPRFFLLAWAPGVMVGLLLCRVQGEMEHAHDGAPISHYGALYNFFWFNDGHHVEHHQRPTEHWSRLTPAKDARVSALPPLLRWAERVATALGWLERLNLGSSVVRSYVVSVHRRALQRALDGRTPESVAIVGGGLFPRTVLALSTVLPNAKLTVIDASAESIAIARAHLGARADAVTFIESVWDERHDVYGLVIFPLAYVGDRRALYRGGRSLRLVHDWLWRGGGPIVSLLLLKRLNVVGPK